MNSSFDRNPIPINCGIGLRSEHYREVLNTLPSVGWLEVHSENFFGNGGLPLNFLEQIRQHYPLSLHGVGLFLGSIDPLSYRHLDSLKKLIKQFEPKLVSEHLCWGMINGRYLNDLLPLPYTEEALNFCCEQLDRIHEYLGQTILIENVSSYLQYKHSTLPEWEFLAELSRRTGCGILLDVNNIYVSASNHNFDPMDYLSAMPADSIKEIHLAGFDDSGDCLIDTHDRPVFPEVWELYDQTIKLFGARPTLIEWDSNLPELSRLVEEAEQANSILESNNAFIA